MSDIEYDGDVEFKIRQVKYMDEFSHWEGELLVKGEVHAEATAPTFWGVSDSLTEYIFEQTRIDEMPVLDVAWFSKDANNR